MAIVLRDKETDREIGTITEAQLAFLRDQLEEEAPDDQDYYLNVATLEAFEQAGADPALLAVLRGALGGREEIEIRWVRT